MATPADYSFLALDSYSDRPPAYGCKTHYVGHCIRDVRLSKKNVGASFPLNPSRCLDWRWRRAGCGRASLLLAFVVELGESDSTRNRAPRLFRFFCC